jgi:hypothetical protein
MALLYPAGRQTTQEPSQVLASTAQSATLTKWPGGRKLVREFLGLPEIDRPWKPPNIEISFLIATLPDPIDSGLPHMFDRNLGSIQAALQADGYLLSSFDLPWQKCLLGHNQNSDDSKKGKDKHADKEKQKACEKEPWDTQPGLLLVSNREKNRLLLLYVVGETPASGIHQDALHTALDEMAFFCGWRNDGGDSLLSLGLSTQQCTHKKVRILILGPTFSGSAQSLDFALSSWMHSTGRPNKVSLRMISGTATAIDLKTSFPNLQELYPGQHAPDSPLFSSTQVPDKVTWCKLLDYLKHVEPDPNRRRIALLSEGGTVYGQQENLDQERSPCPENQDTEIRQIWFPRHVSQLRAALEKVRQSQQQTSPQLPSSPQGLSLAQALEEVNQPQDTDAVPPLSQLDPATAEQVTAQLLSTISHEGYRYVGILATDVRDTIFLAQEVRDHCPSTVLFTFNPDLLFLHPEVNSSLRGMLLVTSYPLFNTNLLWSPPHPPHAQSHLLTQFPDQGSEGTYNATLALLLHDEQMLEYGLPFEPAATLPPLWITVVGRNQMWPLHAYDMQGTFAQDYIYASEKKGEEEEDKGSWFAGVYPTGTTILMSALTALCIVFCLPLLRRFWRSAGPGSPAAPWFGGAWLERAFGEAVSETYRRPAELYLLAACACLGVFLAISLTAYLMPAIVMSKLQVDPWRTGEQVNGPQDRFMNVYYWFRNIYWGRVAFSTLCAVSVGALFAASGSLCAALWPRRKKQPARKTDKIEDELHLPALVSAITVVVALALLAAFLSRDWLSGVGSDDYRSAFFTSLRSLDLFSGVSPLVPLLLILVAGFLWALSSFCRVRQLECFESKSGFLSFAGPFSEIHKLEGHVRSHLGIPSLRLPGAIVVIVLAACWIGYLFGFCLVHSFEGRPFYRLLGFAFFAVSLALWCGVLRFCCVWQALHRLLHHLHCAPPRAYKRFPNSCPAAHKIDLASPPPALAALAYSIDQARTLYLRAIGLVEAEDRRARLKPVVGDEARWGSAEIRGPEARWSIAVSRGRTESGSPAREMTTEQVETLQRLSDQMAPSVRVAEEQLARARKADVEGDWRQVLTHQVAAQEALSPVFTEVSLALQDTWWKEVSGASEKAANSKAGPEEDVFRLGEDFLVGRLAHFLAYVLPQMQNLIVTSISGLLLLLFAVNSYPFQPHNFLLFFNWVVILSFVGIAMWVFVQMSRDPVLSSLNGTKAGKINWDWDFIFRILIYGIVPILALLGAQFPQSVGQIVSHLLPSEAMHH